MKNFNELTSNFIESNRTYSYFINWEKVNRNVIDVEIRLNILNSVIGAENIKDKLKIVLSQYPEVIEIFPILIAVRLEEKRNKKELALCKIEDGYISQIKIDFKSYNEDRFDEYYEFLLETGIIELIENKRVKNLVDYVIGVEVGLDSNGRKNRSGHIMEDIVENHLKKLQEKLDFEYLKEANAHAIEKHFNLVVEVDKSSRRFDFVINYKNELYMIEVNFYSGGGSKLKATAGEYKGLNDNLKNQGYNLIWVTDGKGWETALLPLEEVFNNNDYIFNISDLNNGKLERLLNNEL